MKGRLRGLLSIVSISSVYYLTQNSLRVPLILQSPHQLPRLRHISSSIHHSLPSFRHMRHHSIPANLQGRYTQSLYILTILCRQSSINESISEICEERACIQDG